MRWWTSDHHFGHKNIIDYANRPFENVHAMNMALVERHNDIVSDDDEVWILGDLVMGNHRMLLRYAVSKMRGTKILVPGNHDLCWQGRNTTVNHSAKYHDEGAIARITHEPPPIRLAGQTVRLNHFPYRAEAREWPQRHADWRPEDTGDWLLCGHVHNAWRQRGRQINVGVDAWHYEPVNDDTLAALIAAGPNNTPCPTTTTPLEPTTG